jgi:hypothetical protein
MKGLEDGWKFEYLDYSAFVAVAMQTVKRRQLADAGDFGAGLQVRPASTFRNPEYVDGK